MSIKKHLKRIANIVPIALIAGSAILGTPTGQAADTNTQNSVDQLSIIQDLQHDGTAVYPIGNSNTAYAKYFTGDSFLYRITSASDPVSVSNVTFAPGSINNWHVHHGSCQVLAGVSGKGYYQIWGQPVQEIKPGTSVVIPENVKHWHGAQHEGWFQHLSILASGASTEWLEPVNPDDYAKLK